MIHRTAAVLFATTALSTLAFHAPALAADATDTVAVEGVEVRGGTFASSSATGLDLSLRETPQSVSVVGQEQIEDFALTNVNDLLDHVVGVNVERVETDRTYYNARGFDITNFQVDGVGLPLIWGIQFGDLDTALFERVEIVRGADAMMTGTGNPSATVNYVRKRPTEAFQASATAQYGSWDDKRLEADVSGPLNASGTLSGRFVYANEDKDSYLDHYGVNRNVYYGVLTWRPAPNLDLTAGYSRQDNRARGVLWGALPLAYSDGTRIDYPSSASTSADWTYWDTLDQNVFGEAVLRLNGGWQVKATGAYKQFKENAKLLYAFGDPDPVTGLGVGGMSGIYPSKYNQSTVDLSASGPFRLFGRSQQLLVGANVSRSHGKEYENFYGGSLDYPAVSLWKSVQVAEPVYPGAYLAADQTDRMTRLYAATHLDLADRLKVVLGVNWVKLTSSGYSYGVDTPRNERAASPYAGVVFDLTPNVSAYASYTDIFNPQSEVDLNHATLPAAHGRSYEAGLKSEWFDRKLYATASVFKAEQAGLAEYAGSFPDGKSYYAGLDTRVKGYEFEVAGRITDGWTLGGGWTGLKIEDSTGAPARLYLPRKSLKLTTTYVPRVFDRLKVGAALRWQSKVSVQDIVLVTQDSYAVVDLMASLKLTERARATLNLRNAGNKKYLTSLKWNQSYYAAPRSASLALSYDF